MQNRSTPSPYTDPSAPGRWVWIVPYLYVLGAFLTIPIYAISGGAVWSFAFPLLYVTVIPTLVDLLVGRNRVNPEEATIAALKQDRFYDGIAYGLIPLHYGVFFASVWLVASVNPPLWAWGVFAVGVGIFNGNLITIGHELGHRNDIFNRRMAKFALGLSGYGHFTIEHNRGHHVKVATPDDCASSRMGESVYAFALRELPGAFTGGWRFERDRLTRKKLPVWSLHNEIIQVYAVSVAVALIVTVIFGWRVLPFIVLHHFFSWFALTLVNYIEHYGLLRRRTERGRYEPCAPHHSWNANHTFSNLITLHLQRHSDHHANPARPYACLRDFDGVPELPFGYPGSIALASVPPLWFRVMDPKVLDWASGDIANVNMCPRSEGRLTTAYAS